MLGWVYRWQNILPCRTELPRRSGGQRLRMASDGVGRLSGSMFSGAGSGGTCASYVPSVRSLAGKRIPSGSKSVPEEV